MTGSMYAAIAGLQTHMQKMNVIGNNIANANTYGFKPGVTSFSESMYTSISNSTAGGNEYGGTNASQIGYGSQVASIDLNMTGGTYAPTGINSHLYLDGNGFFMVGPKPDDPISGYMADPNDLTLKRVGNFFLDSDGYLVDNNGYCVYGFMPQGDGNGAMAEDGDGNVVWDTCLRPIRLPVMATVSDAGTGIKEGGPLYPELNPDDNTLTWTEADGTPADEDKRVKVQSVNLSVDKNGLITAVTQDNQALTVGIIPIGSVVNPNGLTKESDGYYKAGNNAGDVVVGTCGGAVEGALNNEDATDPDNVNLMMLTGAGKTKILSGGLESSKTDVATEFADLITTQRGFQANTKIITVTDEMLSDLVSMKR